MPANRNDWPRLKDLFNSILDHPAAERAAQLERASREHPDLADDLRALLASHDDAPDFLEQAPSATTVTGDDHLASADAEPGVLTVGDVLDQTYDVEAALGHGGMGVVYRVRHRALTRAFAAKLIHTRVSTDPAFLELFTREAEALGRLKHPHIVDVTDFGVDRAREPRPYLVMELLTGRTLEDRLRGGALADAATLSLFEGIADALDYAHEQGVLHLDLKPANIIVVDTLGKPPAAKILDFGLAQFSTSSSSEDRSSAGLIGTPAYMAPELWRGDRPGAAADIYALGVMWYEALVGRRPFEGSVAEIAEQVRDALPPSPSSLNPQLPPEVDAALLALLAKEPSARPSTARAAVDLVRRAGVAARQRTWQRVERPRRLIAASVITTVLTLAMVQWSVPLLHAWEEWTIDVRFRLAVPLSPSHGIVLLMLDEASLQVDPRPLAESAEVFGADLQRVFDVGARGVALDLLLPASWGQSPAFTKLVVQHADRLTLSAFSSPSGDVVGPECVKGLIAAALGLQRASSLFGYVNLDQDSDGISRRARTSYRDRAGGRQSSFAGHAVSTAQGQGGLLPAAEEFWIDHAVDSDKFARISWSDLDRTLRERPDLVRGRLVFVGADYAGSGDRALIPNRGTIPGVALHALIAETILAGYPVRSVAASVTAVAAGVVCLLLCSTVLLARSSGAALLVLPVALAYVGGALLLSQYGRTMIAIVGPVMVWLSGVAIASVIRRYRPPCPQD